MGSMTTLYMYMHRNTAFRYFGAFSGGIAGGKHFSLEDKALADRVLMIGCGEKDIAWNQREIGVPPTIEALKAKGLPFIPYFVPGGHDWYCWPQIPLGRFDKRRFASPLTPTVRHGMMHTSGHRIDPLPALFERPKFCTAFKFTKNLG